MTKRSCDKGITNQSECCCYVVLSKVKLESKKLERKSQLQFKGEVNLATLVIFFVVICVTKADGTGTNQTSDPIRGFHIGDSCVSGCSQVIQNSFCNSTTSTCQCLDSHPIVIENVACVKSRSLHETCTYDKQCRSHDPVSLCTKLEHEEASVCSCRPGYYADKEHDIPIKFRCFPDSHASFSQNSVPAIVGLAICLTILSFLLCFMFNLFSRSRWVRARGYADANDPPPTIILEEAAGTTIDIEKQLYQPEELEPLTPSPSPSSIAVQPTTSINITCASPSPSILKHTGSGSFHHRRGSGNNNSNFASTTSRRSSGNVSFNSRRTSLQRNGLTVSGTDLKESATSSRRSSSFNNPSGTAPTSGSPSRRSSSNVSLRSRSGSRKTSIATKNGISADLIKALKELETGDGDIEQTITIIPNPRAKRRGSMASYAFPELHSRASKSKQEPENLLILTRTRTDRHGRRHSVAVPLIPPPEGEKFEGGYHVERNPITGGATLVPPEGHFVRGRSSSERRRSVRDPAGRPTTAPVGPPATAREPKPPVRKDTLSIPAGDGRRRHSYQSGSSGTAGITRDLDRLRVGDGAAAAQARQGISPRPSQKRRKPSTRRSSRSGFLHFLDLAIAN